MLTRVLISLPLVKVFISVCNILVSLYSYLYCMLSCICMLTWKYLYITVMALVGFSASAVQALTYQNGDYIGSLKQKGVWPTVLYNGFRFVLGYRNCLP